MLNCSILEFNRCNFIFQVLYLGKSSWFSDVLFPYLCQKDHIGKCFMWLVQGSSKVMYVEYYLGRLINEEMKQAYRHPLGNLDEVIIRDTVLIC